MILDESLKAVIDSCINYADANDTIFLANRLHTEYKTPDSLHLLASSYIRAGYHLQAYSLLKSDSKLNPACKILLTKCCMNLDNPKDRDYLKEAEQVLLGENYCKRATKKLEQSRQLSKTLDELATEYGELGCYFYQLVGIIFSQTERHDSAIECFKKSLKINPFLWTSYETLCNLGGTLPSSDFFSKESFQKFLTANNIFETKKIPSTKETPLIPGAKQRKTSRNLLSSNTSSTPLLGSITSLPEETPKQTTDDSSMPLVTPTQSSPSTLSLPNAPEKRPPRRAAAIRKPAVLGHSASNRDNKSDNTGGRMATRRSTRLFGSAVSENTEQNRSGASQGRRGPSLRSSTKTDQENINSDRLKENQSRMLPPTNEPTKQAYSIFGPLVNFLAKSYIGIGNAYYLIAQYRSQEALVVLDSFPARHASNPYVRSLVGKAHFLLANFKEAATVYEKLHREYPTFMEGMDLYSTALWHLQKEIELSKLAQEMNEMCRKEPECWVVVGNCFSLQKEHENATKFLKRAIQLAPRYGYGISLLGSEYLMIEDFEKALSCHQTALRCDHRLYISMYGMGMVFFKQEKLPLAAMHFKKAVKVNPNCPVLLCQLAITYQAMGRGFQESLDLLERALDINPKCSVSKFYRASILLASEQPYGALSDLDSLLIQEPNESLVYFLIAKVQKKLGNIVEYHANLNLAMEMDPKGVNNRIKESINKQLLTDNGQIVEDIPEPEDDLDPEAHNMPLSEDEEISDDDTSSL